MSPSLRPTREARGPGAARALERSAGRCHGVRIPGGLEPGLEAWTRRRTLTPTPGLALRLVGSSPARRGARWLRACGGTGDHSERLTRLAALGPAPAALEKLEVFCAPYRPTGIWSLSTHRSPEIAENHPCWQRLGEAQWLAARLLMSAHLCWNPKPSALLWDGKQLLHFSAGRFLKTPCKIRVM